MDCKGILNQCTGVSSFVKMSHPNSRCLQPAGILACCGEGQQLSPSVALQAKSADLAPFEAAVPLQMPERSINKRFHCNCANEISGSWDGFLQVANPSTIVAPCGTSTLTTVPVLAEQKITSRMRFIFTATHTVFASTSHEIGDRMKDDDDCEIGQMNHNSCRLSCHSMSQDCSLFTLDCPVRCSKRVVFIPRLILVIVFS